MSNKVSRDDAWSLLNEYTKSESLIKHALGVEAAMRWYAKHYNEDQELWGVTGLLHDFDYEQNPQVVKNGDKLEGHPFVGCEILRSKGYPEEVITAILGHATYSGVARETLMAKALFAVDELSGLITAAVLVRPDKSLFELKVKSVKKKLKDKAFARGVNRDDVALGIEELEIDLDTHIQNVIDGMKEAAEVLGLSGASPS